MGLDMYLYREYYVQNWDHQDEKERHTITILKGGEPAPEIDTSRIAYLKEQVGYWRKANMIHAWFVRNCQDGVDQCQHSYVGHEQLDDLLAACKLVLAAKGGPNEGKVVSETLPPAAGFFFGSTEVDVGYWQDINHTVKLIEKLQAEPGHKYGTYLYHSSW